MAPSHVAREKRPCCSRRSPSGAAGWFVACSIWSCGAVALGAGVLVDGAGGAVDLGLREDVEGRVVGVAGGVRPAAARMASSSPVPTTASTSGMFLWISSR